VERRAPSTGAGAAIALRPGVLWLTGERGAGKTALARWLAARADRAGARVEILDDDTVGPLFPAGGSRAEQDLRVRRLSWLASRLEAHGAAVIVAVDASEDDARRFARSVASDFVEIHLHATPEVLTSRAGARDLVAFEAPVQPELRLDTGRLSLDEAGGEVIAWLREWSTQS
jgi:adenylylsulfate kinase-like enzyme